MKPYRFKALLFVLLCFIGFSAKAQTSPDWVWAKHDSLGYEPRSMAIDGSGNIYVAYQYTFTKYDAAGNLQWRLPLGNQGVKLTGVATDPIGNIYFSGYFWGTAQIDTVSITSRGQNDVFLAKFNPNGKVFWARSGGGTGNPAQLPGAIDDASFALAVDSAGNSYIAGKIHTLGTSVYFDSVTIPPFNGSSFGAKYDTNGKIKWVWILGIQAHESMKVAIGPLGSVYYSVWPSVSKFNADGSVAWHKPLNGQASIDGLGVDQAGNCFISGGFMGTFNFGSTTLTAPNSFLPSAIYVAKYDASGNPVWATQSTGGSVTHESLTLDQHGHPYISGSTNGNVTFGPNIMLSTANEDAFVMKFDALNGAPVWGQTGGGGGIDVGQLIKTLPNGDCIVAGKFHRAATFGNITVQPTQTTYPNNIFLAKISMNPLSVPKAAAAQNLHLYPNPASSEVTVTAKELRHFRLQAFNLTGQLIFEGNFHQEAQLQVQNWPAGLYVLKLTGNSGTLTRKLAVVR